MSDALAKELREYVEPGDTEEDRAEIRRLMVGAADEMDRMKSIVREWIAKIHSGQTLQFTGCTWCGLVWEKWSEDSAERIKTDALAHATVCPSHPLRIERDRLADLVSEAQTQRDSLRTALAGARAEVERLQSFITAYEGSLGPHDIKTEQRTAEAIAAWLGDVTNDVYWDEEDEWTRLEEGVRRGAWRRPTPGSDTDEGKERR